jgi:hypothetical protein
LNSNFPKIGYIFGHGTLTFIYLKEHTRQVLEQAMKCLLGENGSIVLDKNSTPPAISIPKKRGVLWFENEMSPTGSCVKCPAPKHA